jgi:predicted transcriptional regulator
MKTVIGHLTGGGHALLVCRGRQFIGILTKFDVLHFVTNGGGR